MISPHVTPGVKQGHDGVGLRIERRDVRPLLQVTTCAASAQVVPIVWAIMLSADDMIHLMGDDQGLLGEMAILALVAGASPDERADLP